MTIALACCYALAMLALTVLFVVEWIRNYRQIRKYLKYGLVAGTILVGLDLTAVALSSSVWSGRLALGLVMDVFVFIRAVGFTMLGMYYCAWLGYPSFRLVNEPAAASEGVNGDDQPASEEAPYPASSSCEERRADADTVIERALQTDHLDVVGQSAVPLIPPFNGKRCVLHAALVVLVAVLYSTALFAMTSPKISEMARNAFGLEADALQNAGTVTPQLVLLLLTFAFGEEIFFRLGIQNFLACRLRWQGQKYWLAIVVTTCLWTLGHAGTLDPGWAKLAQIFPLGLMLGWLARRHGVESAIGAHAFFNLIMAFLWSPLMR